MVMNDTLESLKNSVNVHLYEPCFKHCCKTVIYKIEKITWFKLY